ncbi:RodZ domain-containing protein [Thiolapillus sp.]
MAAAKIHRRSSQKRDETASGTAVPSPGKRLRQAREAMGMEVATVAEQLHLSKVMVQALEEDNYEVLPARVFVRGYYRNFARLVGVSPETVLKEFGQRCPAGEDCSVPPAVAQGVRKEIGSNHGLVRLATWLIVIALLTVFGLWWKSYLDKGSVAEDSASIAATEVVTGDAAPSDSTERHSAPAESTPPLEEKPLEISTEGEAAAVEEQATSTPAVVEEEAAQTAPPEESQPGVSAADQDSQDQPPAAVPGRVLLSFSGDCWVDVRDSTRNFKLVGRRQAGEKFELEGEPPYKMVLGNARNVSITVDGKPFDLAPYTRGNVAKLTFDPTNI